MKLQDVHQILSMFAPQSVTFETLTVNLFQVENWNVRNKEHNNYKIYSFSHNHGLVESGCWTFERYLLFSKTLILLNHDYGREEYRLHISMGNKLFFKQLVVGHVSHLMTCRGLPLGKHPHALAPKNLTAKEKTTWNTWEVWKMLGFEFSSQRKTANTFILDSSEDRKDQAKTMPGTALLKLPTLQRFSDPQFPHELLVSLPIMTLQENYNTPWYRTPVRQSPETPTMKGIPAKNARW